MCSYALVKGEVAAPARCQPLHAAAINDVKPDVAGRESVSAPVEER